MFDSPQVPPACLIPSRSLLLGTPELTLTLIGPNVNETSDTPRECPAALACLPCLYLWLHVSSTSLIPPLCPRLLSFYGST